MTTPASSCEPAHAVIIGTGYAGAIAALRLAEAGVSSVVLERGRRWPITERGDTFATPEAPDGRVAWLSTTSPFTPKPLNVYVGVLEAIHGTGITALTGAGVGGGSLVNNAVIMQPPARWFERSFGHVLSHREMAEVWYPRALELIGAHPMPDDVFASSYYTSAREFSNECRRATLSPFRCDMAIDWPTVREEMAGTRVPSVILGYSIWGVNSGAKRSVDRTILAAAEATGRVAVHPLTRAVDITPDGTGYKVTCDRIDEEGHVLDQPTFAAPFVFLAAGSCGTTRLLVRARDRGSLRHLAPTIGQGWGSNGDQVSERIGMPYDNPTDGGPSGIAIQDETPQGPVTLLNFPWRTPPPGGGALGTLGLTLSPPLGTFTYDASHDTVNLTWPAADPRVTQLTQAVNGVLDRINAANPGTSTVFTQPAITSHPVGGVGLGVACDHHGELHGYRNLFVIDSSLLPGSCGAVPPALTVSALADRCVELALRRIVDASVAS